MEIAPSIDWLKTSRFNTECSKVIIIFPAKMPAYLSKAIRDYNQIRRVNPSDPIAQLEYFQASSFSSGSRQSRSKNEEGRTRANGNGVAHMYAGSRRLASRGDIEQFGGSSNETSDLSEIGATDRAQSSATLSSSSYSSKLINLMLKRTSNDRRGTRREASRQDEQEGHEKGGVGRKMRAKLSSSGQLLLKNMPRSLSRHIKSHGQKGAVSDSPPFESSGFGEEVLVGATSRAAPLVYQQKQQIRRQTGPAILRDGRLTSLTNQLDGKQQISVSAKTSLNPVTLDGRTLVSPEGQKFALIQQRQPRSRLKRRKINRINKRMLIAGTDSDGNPMLLESGQFDSDPYALSELFSQSEIPGFREIFSSNSYLRKFCWVVAFLFMTVLSFNDISELVREYFSYPITVNVRLRDTARLPFPAVTVCNLNVVRYSGLCSSSKFELAGQIPGELRDKLCGIQVDKKKSGNPNNDGKNYNSTDHNQNHNHVDVIDEHVWPPTGPPSGTTKAGPFSGGDSGTTEKGGGHFDDINNIVVASKPSPPTTIAPQTTTNEHAGGPTESAEENRQSASTKDIDASESTNGTTAKKAADLPTTHRPSGSLDLGSDFSPIPRGSSGVNSGYRQLTIGKRSIALDEGSGARPFASGKRRVVMTQSQRRNSSSHTHKLGISSGASSVPGSLGGSSPVSRLAASSVQVNSRGTGNTNMGDKRQSSDRLQPPGAHYPQGTTNHSSSSLGWMPPGHHETVSTSSNPVPTTTFSPPIGDGDFELTERQERELQENLTNWLAVMYQLDSQLTRSLGHQFDDMILRCTMKSINCTRRRAFEWSFSPTEGNCFTYRSKAKRRSSGAKDGELDQQYTYEQANLAGTNDGLELVLNLEKAEYISGSSQVGALVMIHHPDELGYAASEATFIAPEFTTYIGLKMMNITRLPAPYPEQCVDSWPAKFQDSSHTIRNSTYSQQTCLKICLQKTIQAHCNCQSAFLPIVEASPTVSTGNESLAANSSKGSGKNDTNNQSANSGAGGGHKQRVIICDTRRKQTRTCVRDVNLRAADRVHHCECPPKCQVVRYDKTISMARWPTREDNVTFDRGKMDVNFQNLAKVIVYFQTMTCEEVTQQAVFNAAKIFSALGGIMGMYVGFSFLSVFEIFEVMSRKLWHCLRVKISSLFKSRCGRQIK